MSDLDSTIFAIEDYIGGNIEGVEQIDRMALTVFLRITLTELIANQVREARIDELKLIEQAQQDEDKWSLFCMDDTSDFGNYINQRIKELGE